jgi:hypothetical protein
MNRVRLFLFVSVIMLCFDLLFSQPAQQQNATLIPKTELYRISQ